jgi:hypothetical protein
MLLADRRCSMHGLALLLLGAAVPVGPTQLEAGVEEIQSKHFLMPLRIDPARGDEIEKVRLFVSRDRGKTWKHCRDYDTTAEHVAFSAPRDGVYWFAVQTVLKDGIIDPPDLGGLAPAMKVYVNTGRRALKPRKSYEELEQEVAQLRKTVEELKGRIRDLEPWKGRSK